MTDYARRTAEIRRQSQQASLAAFMRAKARFDTALEELRQASAEHFGADPEASLWAEAEWLGDAATALTRLADQHHRRGEYAKEA